MKIRFCAFILALFIGLGLPGHAPAAVPTGQERILSMDVEMSIHERGWITVVERIVFEAAGRNIKRGIVRELPKHWTRPDGSRGSVDYYSIKVRRDGELESRHFEESSSRLEIYIGNSSIMLRPGIHEYVIEYDVSGALLRKDGVDSLYWNATGNEWAFPIERASFRLNLPGALRGQPDQRIIESDYFTGELGAQGEDAKLLPDGAIASTKTLHPGDGLTVFFSWPTSITANVKVKELQGGLVYALVPSLRDLYVFAPTLFLLLFHGFLIRRWGWGHKRFQVIPIFDPPPGLTPGGASYAFKGKYGYNAFAADLLALVDKKYLFLAEVKDPAGASISVISRYPVPGDEESLEGITPEKPGQGEELPPGGEAFYKLLFFGSLDAVELDAKKPRSGSRIVDNLRLGSGISLTSTYSKLSADCSKKCKGMFRPVRLMLILGLCFWFFIMAVALGVFRGSDAAAGFISMLVLPSIPLFMIVLLLVAVTKGHTPAGVMEWFRRYSLASIYIGFVVLLMLSGNIWHVSRLMFEEFFGFGSVWEAASPSGALLSIVIAFAASILCWFFLSRRSEMGLQALATAEGIKMYLKTAEEHRFEALYSPEEKVRHFESLLPYALALDVGETWANNFAEYCKKAGMSELATREFEHMHRSARISRSIGSSTQRSQAPSSSSSGRSSSGRSGGGGSSGGGAGGGGGRGW